MSDPGQSIINSILKNNNISSRDLIQSAVHT